ncbi:MAG: insulinase family protein, partial [Zavarzinella sp.]|nr:insulinase family protein [Zavarzinella sp.]
PNIPKLLRDHGARADANTWYDRTTYFETMSATDDNLEFGIRLEADRLVNSYVKREDLISEMTVVRNEFEKRENDPGNVLRERMMAAAYEWHNYGKTPIGNRSDIERVPIESLQAFYRKHYRPDNVVVTIAGQFGEKKAFELVGKYFGALKRPAQKLDATYTQEPAQDGERVVTLRRVGSVGVAAVMYHVPAAVHPDFAAIQVLARCLGRQPGGRLYKALVETKKATGVGTDAALSHDPGVLQVVADAGAGGVDAARDALIETLEGLARNPVTDEEVAEARRVFAEGHEQSLADAPGFAEDLTEWIASGDWRLFFLNRDRLDRVTAADVNRVAQKYLVRTNRTVGVYYPTDKPDRAEIPDAPSASDLVKDYKGRTAVAPGESLDPTPANLEKRVTRGTLGPIKTAFLPKKTRGQTATVRLTLRYGNEQSLIGNVVAAELLPNMLLRGTKKHSRQQFVDELNRLGAGISVAGGPGELTVAVEAKRTNLPAALRLAVEALREPAFPAAEFEQVKAAVLQSLAANSTEPGPLAAQAITRKLNSFPKGDIRYQPTIEEAIGLVKDLTLDRVRAVYETQLGAPAGELVAVGDFDPKVVTAELRPVLEGWTSSVSYRRIPNALTPVEWGETIVLRTPDKANAVYLAGLAFPLTDTDTDYPAMKVGNFLLGGSGLSSRLATRIREEKGLSYTVSSSVNVGSEDPVATFEVFAITNPANISQVDALIAAEIDRFLKDGVTPEELEGAKKAFLDQRKVSRADDGGLVGQLALQTAVGQTFQWDIDLEAKVAALTPADIQKAFRKYVDPKKLVIAHAGDFPKK